MSGKASSPSAKILELPKVDLLGRMTLAESIVEAFAKDPMLIGNHRGILPCVGGMHETVAQKVQEVEESLVDLFSDVE
jgi:hypothetical protein